MTQKCIERSTRRIWGLTCAFAQVYLERVKNRRAKYAATCPICHKAITVGQWINWHGTGGWIHSQCQDLAYVVERGYG